MIIYLPRNSVNVLAIYFLLWSFSVPSLCVSSPDYPDYPDYRTLRLLYTGMEVVVRGRGKREEGDESFPYILVHTYHMICVIISYICVMISYICVMIYVCVTLPSYLLLFHSSSIPLFLYSSMVSFPFLPFLSFFLTL